MLPALIKSSPLAGGGVPSPSPAPSPPATIDGGDSIPEKARRVALARHALVRALDAYRREHEGRRAAEVDREFMQGFAVGAHCEGLRELVGEPSLQTVYRWRTALDGTEDWRRIAPQYGRAARAPRLSPIEERIFLGFLLSPNKIPVGTATKFTRLVLKNRGIPCEKSSMTFRRFAEDFAARRYDIWVLMREGQKALKDKVAPYIKRDPGKLDVGDALVADGHRLNFQVINPFTGRPCRATMVAYLDWKSYDLAGYEIMINENTQCVAAALRNGILRLGKFPRVAYQDNGKAFRARFFQGSASFEEAGLGGLFGRLGITPVYAAPYNARAKIIERWFRDFSNTFERLLPSYIGASIVDKPAYLSRNEKFHKSIHNEYVPTIEETVELIGLWLEFHEAQECPHAKGRSIGEVFAEGRGPGVDTADLDDLMMDMKVANIGRNGIRFLGQDYYNDGLYGLREQVLIRYSLFDLSYIKIYDIRSGDIIGTAPRVEAVHPLARVMGAPKDMEALSRGMATLRGAEKKTVQGAKELMGLGGIERAKLDWQQVAEAAPRVIDRLEREDVPLPPHEISIPDECVIAVATPSPSPSPEGRGGTEETSPVGRGEEAQDDATPESTLSGVEPERLTPPVRPLFGSDIERYEWHIEFGLHTEEDAAWCAWFRTTGDFRMLYGQQAASAE